MVYDGYTECAIVYLSETFFLKSNGLVLPSERLTRLQNFGRSLSGPAYLYRPTHIDQVAKLFDLAGRNGIQVGLRGAGRSYSDAAINTGEIVLDLQRMNRVLEWNPEMGVINVEPGVTIEQLWKYILEDGWWPPVVPGTMFPTIGGCLASNIHGKNNWTAGTLGEHVLEFSALLPNGKEIVCSPRKNKALFQSMIGGMGMLGVFTKITLQMKRIFSGNLEVFSWAVPTLVQSLESLEQHKENDYIVGWIDCTSGGQALGRGQLHKANYLADGDDPAPVRSLRIENQTLPDNFLGLMPKSVLWRLMRLTMNNLGVRVGNVGKYLVSRTIGNRKQYLQSLVAFNFLLDYVPNWERSYGRGGLIQYQSFLPKEAAQEVYLEMLKLCKRRRFPAYLGVLKRHRPDDFLLTHAVDGYSLALDFRVSNRNRGRLRTLTRELNKMVLGAGGRFYFAKDSALSTNEVVAYLGENTVARFKALKSEHDPDNLLQTDLFRRCFLNGGV